MLRFLCGFLPLLYYPPVGGCDEHPHRAHATRHPRGPERRVLGNDYAEAEGEDYQEICARQDLQHRSSLQ